MRPTFIYWLVDTRPETIAAGWHSGYPFYCGKTIGDPKTRLAGHRSLAVRETNRKVCQRVLECGEHMRIEVVEIVPPSSDWRARERSWIRLTRFSFPDNCNSSDGGESPHIGEYVEPKIWRAELKRRLGRRRERFDKKQDEKRRTVLTWLV